jgi:hypothetical protein
MKVVALRPAVTKRFAAALLALSPTPVTAPRCGDESPDEDAPDLVTAHDR